MGKILHLDEYKRKRCLNSNTEHPLPDPAPPVQADNQSNQDGMAVNELRREACMFIHRAASILSDLDDCDTHMSWLLEDCAERVVQEGKGNSQRGRGRK